MDASEERAVGLEMLQTDALASSADTELRSEVE
jgi:hypothetical protein